MDNQDLAKVAITAFFSATGAVVAWSWRLSLLLSKHEEKHAEHDRRHVEMDSKYTRLDADQDKHSREQGDRWNEINRTLGTIQGEIIAGRKK